MPQPARKASPRIYSAPLVIYCTGGSGSRVLARIVRDCGYFVGFGPTLNSSEDSLAIAEVSDRWIPEFLGASSWIQQYSGEKHHASTRHEGTLAMREHFNSQVALHRSGMIDVKQRWGWKEPRTIFLLPFMHARYPRIVTIQLIRDGRDMAFSGNQNQLRLYGPFVLSEEEQSSPEAVQSILLWSRINRAAARYAEQNLKANHMRIRFEDMCQHAERCIEEIFAFLKISVSPNLIEKAAGEIRIPDSVGRWKCKDEEIRGAVTRAGEDALLEFGYL
jgi:hypothetical protein